MPRIEDYEEGVVSRALSRDGTRIARGSRDGTVRVWDAATGVKVAQMEGHRHSVAIMAWSRDGTRLATGSDDNTARVWDAVTGAEIACLKCLGNVHGVAWSRDGTRLATGEMGSMYGLTPRLWDPATGRLLRHSGVEEEAYALLNKDD